MALAITWIGIFLLASYASRWGLLDIPDDERKKHQEAKPIAGVALGIGVLSTAWLWPQLDLIWPVLVGGVAFMLLGADDDRNPRPAKWRLLGQFLIATGVVLWGQFQFESFSLFGFSLELGWLAVPFTVLWMVTLVNAFNFIDGSDGLSLGVALVIAAGFGIASGSGFVQSVAWAMVGSGLIFWWFNKPVAKAFLGDGGAYLLGFLLGVLTLLDAQSHQSTFLSFNMAMMFLLPLGDMIFAIMRRLRAKRAIFSADHQHIHHQLQSRWGAWGMLGCLYALTFIGVLLGWWR